jgi:hypothetical protein
VLLEQRPSCDKLHPFYWYQVFKKNNPDIWGLFCTEKIGEADLGAYKGDLNGFSF